MTQATFRKWLRLLPVMLFAAVFAACSDDNNDENEKVWSGEKPTIVAGEATATTLSFSINTKDADKTAWVCVKKTETIPTANQILSTGTTVAKSSSAVTQTATGLTASTEYVIQVAAQCGNDAVLISPLSMTTAAEETPAEDKGETLNSVVDATYTTESSTVGNYSLTFSKGTMDANGYPANVGDMLITLDLYNTVDADAVNATLPSGEYVPNTDKSAFSFSPNGCIIYEREELGDEGLVYSFLTSGKITVARSGDVYTITIDCIDLAGNTVKATYEGVIAFVQGASSAYEDFTTDQNVSFTDGQARYYGNWDYPHADDWMAEFFSGEFNSEGELIDGYYLSVADIFTHKLADTSVATPVIEDGTYECIQIATDQEESIRPMTFTYGNTLEFYGETYITGTYLVKVDKTTGLRSIAYITGGTITVSRSGNTYNFTFDMVASTGIKVTGSFSNTMIIGNYCNNASQPVRMGGTLTEDVNLEFATDNQAVAYMLGNYLYPDYNSWMLMMGSHELTSGAYITTEFLAPISDGLTIKPGTYTIFKSSDSKKDPGTYEPLPGHISRGGDLYYSWYVDLSSTDSEGYASVLGRVVGGTMTIAQSGSDYTFTFDFLDDEDHKIQGSWTGPLSIQDATEDTEEAKAMKVKSKRSTSNRATVKKAKQQLDKMKQQSMRRL